MASLERRIETLEAIRQSELCYSCSLRQLGGDASVGVSCPHPERDVTYEGALQALKRTTEPAGG